MKGMGTNEKEIVAVLTELSADQRHALILQFKTMYGKVVGFFQAQRAVFATHPPTH